MTEEPLALMIALPAIAVSMERPRTGLALTGLGELAVCVGTAAHVVRLSPEGWAWLARTAAAMAGAAEEDAKALPPLAHVHREAGHA